MRYSIMLCTVLALATTSAAPAQAMLFGGEVYGQFNTHAMDDWNEVIDDANALGSDFSNITSSLSGGVGARMWPSPNVMVGLAWEPFFPTTEDQGEELKLTANGFLATVAYFFPTEGTGKYGIGAGGGFYSLNGEVTGGGSPDVELTGSTIGFHVLGLAEWIVSPGFGVTAGAGYRIANIKDTEADGVSANPDFETDYSGFMGRAGLVFYLPNGN